MSNGSRCLRAGRTQISRSIDIERSTTTSCFHRSPIPVTSSVPNSEMRSGRRQSLMLRDQLTVGASSRISSLIVPLLMAQLQNNVLVLLERSLTLSLLRDPHIGCLLERSTSSLSGSQTNRNRHQMGSTGELRGREVRKAL